MSQATNWSVPLSGPATPSTFAQRIDDSLNALMTNHRGSSRPSYLAAGSFWVQTIDATEESVYYFDGTHDVYIGKIDLTNGLFLPAASGDLVTADGDEISAICTGAGVSTTPLFKTIAIGDWNMVSGSGPSITHGLDISKILNVGGSVRNDNGMYSVPIVDNYASSAYSSHGVYVEQRDQYYITLGTWGTWTGYSSVDYNRGHLVIQYLS